MSDVRMPIETIREGNKITKVCVEDVYKMINRIIESMNKAYNNSVDIIDSIHKDYGEYEGELIIGTGISQPCLKDAFDEEIGNDIAFMKAKLNANIKKYNFLNRIYKQFSNCLETIEDEVKKVQLYMALDIIGVRTFNPDYLIDKYEIEVEKDESEEENIESASKD